MGPKTCTCTGYKSEEDSIPVKSRNKRSRRKQIGVRIAASNDSVTSYEDMNTRGLIDPRFWESQYDKWIDDAANNPEPGPHPIKDHPWNTQPEVYDIFRLSVKQSNK